MGHLIGKIGGSRSPNTVKTYIAHVKKWIEVVYDIKIQIRLPKNFKYKVNEHEAYSEHDVMELIRELRYQPLEGLEISFASKTSRKGE